MLFLADFDKSRRAGCGIRLWQVRHGSRPGRRLRAPEKVDAQAAGHPQRHPQRTANHRAHHNQLDHPRQSLPRFPDPAARNACLQAPHPGDKFWY